MFQCDPNLVVYGVWINHLDHRLPRIALFAKRDIDKMEELTFDYMMTGMQPDTAFYTIGSASRNEKCCFFVFLDADYFIHAYSDMSFYFQSIK